jgi:hypothetical protein
MATPRAPSSSWRCATSPPPAIFSARLGADARRRRVRLDRGRPEPRRRYRGDGRAGDALPNRFGRPIAWCGRGIPARARRLVASGGDPSRIHSVASFFVSRVDTETDRRLAETGRDDLRGSADVGSHYLDVLPGLLIAALGSALTTPLTTAILSSVPIEKAGVASGALNTSRELAGSLGIAVMGAILAARESASLSHGATAQAAFVSGYSLALVIGAAVVVAGAVIAAIVLRERQSSIAVPALEGVS